MKHMNIEETREYIEQCKLGITKTKDNIKWYSSSEVKRINRKIIDCFQIEIYRAEQHLKNIDL